MTAAVKPRVRIDPSFRGAPPGTLRNPTVGLFAGSLALAAVGWAGWLQGWLPAPASIAVDSVAAYIGFSVFHESVHGIAHHNRRVNTAFGWYGAAWFPIPYPQFRSCHLRHHAHTNDPVLDPDMVVDHRPRWAQPLWLLAVAVTYRTRYYRYRWWANRRQLVQTAFGETVLVAVPVAAVAGGWWRAWLVLWVVPMLVATLVLAYCFDWLPHSPYASTERYLDTRIVPGAGWNTVLLGQSHHLVHHLWTSIPWYRYRAAWRSVEGELVAAGARVEGIRPGSAPRR